MKTFVRIVSAACLALVSAGCREPIDTNRTSVDTGSFGETVVTLVCKRIAYLEDLADGGTTDVSGKNYSDICRLGLAPPDDAPDTLKALLAERDNLIQAVDTIFPEDFLPMLQAYLTSNEFLATYDRDGGTAVPAVDGLIGVLRLLADDPEAIDALARLNVRLGYRPLGPALGAIRAAVNYPDMHQLLLTLSQAITPGGSARGEWQHLIDALGVTLRNAKASPTAAERDDPERTARLAADFLLTERDMLGTTKTIPLVRRDPRGVAQPASLGTLFADADGDGYADLDAVGDYVDANGQPIAAPAPFSLPEGVSDVTWQYRDDEGRPLVADGGALLYNYIDVDKTVLSALARDGVQLFDPAKGTALDLLRGTSALMGTRVMMERTYDNGETLSYRGYDTTQSPLLDMAYGFLQVLRDPGINNTLDLARELLRNDNYQDEVSHLAEAVVSVARVADAHPEAAIPADAPLWDDLIPVVREVLADPALVEDLMRALEKPEVVGLGDRFYKYMSYKDRFDIDPSTQAVVGTFATLVDRTQPDNAFNRSLFQRLLHLVNDSSTAVACNKQNAEVKQFGVTVATYNACEMFRVPDLAIFYVQSIAYAKSGDSYVCEDNGGEFNPTQTRATPEQCYQIGDGWRPRPKADFHYNWNKGLLSTGAVDLLGGDKYVEEQAGIQGMRTHPTPQALNRVLFLDPTPQFLQNIIDPMRDRDGDYFKDQHAGTLPVWEAEGFYDQVRPIVQAFADNGQEKLFVKFLSVLHKHWPSPDSVQHQTVDPNAPGYVWGSDGKSYEPMIADMLSRHQLLEALAGEPAKVLNAVDVPNTTKTFIEVTRDAARYLVNPRTGLTNRLGDPTGLTADGREVAWSPWQVLADAYVGKTERIVASGGEGQAWRESVSEVIDTLARGQEVPTLGWQFKNPRFRGVSVALIDFLKLRIAHHQAAGDLDQWLTTTLPADLQDLLTSPVLAGAADFVLSLQASPETRQQLDALAYYLVDEITYDDTFRTSVTAAADLLQLAISDADVAPLARVAGEALRPERGWLDAHLSFVRQAREADADQALVRILRDLYDETASGRTAVGDLVDGISEVHRANPYQDLGERYTADDFRALFNGLADFLDEEKRGLRKFIGIIQDRNL